MSLDLTIRLYPTAAAYSPLDTFRPVVEAVGAWDRSLGTDWSDFRIRPANPHAKRPERKREQMGGPLRTEELVGLAARVTPRPGLRLSAHLPVRCWQRSRGGLGLGHSVLTVDCWSPDARPA